MPASASAKAAQSLRWARQAGIKNFGYFIIGLPGEIANFVHWGGLASGAVIGVSLPFLVGTMLAAQSFGTMATMTLPAVAPKVAATTT